VLRESVRCWGSERTAINRYNQNVKEDNSANAQLLRVVKYLNLK
jgi:hypothetical protein